MRLQSEHRKLVVASNHRLDTIGVVNLTVKVDSYTARQPFVVVRQLGADALLGCTFIHKHVKSVRPRMKFIELEMAPVLP